MTRAIVVRAWRVVWAFLMGKPPPPPLRPRYKNRQLVVASDEPPPDACLAVRRCRARFGGTVRIDAFRGFLWYADGDAWFEPHPEYAAGGYEFLDGRMR